MSLHIKKDDMTKIQDEKVPITTLIYKNVILFYGFFFFFFYNGFLNVCKRLISKKRIIVRDIVMHIFECDYFKNIFKNVDKIISTDQKNFASFILLIKELQ